MLWIQESRSNLNGPQNDNVSVKERAGLHQGASHKPELQGSSRIPSSKNRDVGVADLKACPNRGHEKNHQLRQTLAGHQTASHSCLSSGPMEPEA